MLRTIRDHLKSVDESYLQHGCFAFRFGFRLFTAGMGAMLHALCPAIFPTVGSRAVLDLHSLIQARHKKRLGGDDYSI